jgi:adenylate cyclase, class 2
MRNLELKAHYKNNFVPQELDEYYYDTLFQKDTYFHVVSQDGKRLKIREENSGTSNRTYAILYDRPNTTDEKISNYDFYEIKESEQFFKVFGPALEEEIIVDKKRVLYLYQNARIHFDTVTNLGSFVEIEVVIKTKDDEDNSHELMSYLIKILGITDNDKISIGYRELLMNAIEE